MVETNPALSLIAFLMSVGSSFGIINDIGIKDTDLLVTRGSPSNILELLNRQVQQIGSICMGRSDCIQPPAIYLRCPHKPCYKACKRCFLLTSEMIKCGCDEEHATPISAPPPATLPLPPNDVLSKNDQLSGRKLTDRSRVEVENPPVETVND